MCLSVASSGGQDYISLKADAFLAFVLMAFIYPLPVHWIWNPRGWLNASEIGTESRDFAGAAVIHLVGGTVALGLALLSKPRPYKFPMKSVKKNAQWSNKKGFGLEGRVSSISKNVFIRS